MPDPLGPLREPDDDSGPARQRALWVMAGLAVLALIVGASMLLFGNGSGGSGQHIDLLPPVRTSGPSAAASTPPRTSSTGATGVPSASSSALPSFGTSPTGPPRTGNPCPSGTTCLVPGDGGALAAANAFRAAHGQEPVPGGVSRDAQLCAQGRGNGPTCKPHYAWTAMPDQDGGKAITKILQFGRDWLLDPGIKDLAVGWAYVGGQYECVLLKSP